MHLRLTPELMLLFQTHYWFASILPLLILSLRFSYQPQLTRGWEATTEAANFSMWDLGLFRAHCWVVGPLSWPPKCCLNPNQKLFESLWCSALARSYTVGSAPVLFWVGWITQPTCVCDAVTVDGSKICNYDKESKKTKQKETRRKNQKRKTTRQNVVYPF